MSRCKASMLLFGSRAKFRTVCVFFTIAIFSFTFILNILFSNFQSNIVKFAGKEVPVFADKKYNPRCTMDTCFDSSRCKQFKVYVYPDDPHGPKVSDNYRKILEAIRRSPFYTENAEEACVFVPNLDTLDRDPISAGFIRDLSKRIKLLPYWSSQPKSSQARKSQPGMNHLLFILFPGTWPNYDVNQLGMDTGNAILARASASKVFMRTGFDISFPLVTSNYPVAGEPSRYPPAEDARIRLNLLTSFKGKRYVIGIGSETRNALYHIHNGKDIIIATTCKHMQNWNLHADARCASDNAYYDTVSYQELLNNSTFCLVPRGRRLGSFRFLEVLEAGCIPVLLANDWELPFAEVIDWSQAAVVADERTLSRLPELLRSIPESQIVKMREQVRFIWSSYFRSVDAIVRVTLMSIRDRLTLRRKNYDVWNRRPGGIVLFESSTINSCEYPSPSLPVRCQDEINKGFTLLATVRQPFCRDYRERLSKLASVFVRSRQLKKAIVVWQCTDRLPPSSEKMSRELFKGLPVNFSFAPLPDSIDSKQPRIPSPSNRFIPSQKDIQTLAVWSVELDVANDLDLQQVKAAYALWLQHPHRLIGFTARAHVWDSKMSVWNYSFKASSHGNFSMVLLNAAVYHRYYHTLYWKMSTPKIRGIVDTLGTGEDILFNCVVGHVSQSAPILLTVEGSKSPASTTGENPTELVNHMGTRVLDVNQRPIFTPNTVLKYRHTCLRAFANHFKPFHSTGYADPQAGRQFGVLNSTNFLPLYYSNLRFVTA